MSKVLTTVLMFVIFLSFFAYQNCGSGNTRQAPGPLQPSVRAFEAIASKDEASGKIVLIDQSLEGALVDNRALDGCAFQFVISENGKQKSFSPKGGDLKLSTDALLEAIQNSYRIRVEGYLRPDLVDTCMAGAIFEVVSAEIIK